MAVNSNTDHFMEDSESETLNLETLKMTKNCDTDQFAEHSESETLHLGRLVISDAERKCLDRKRVRETETVVDREVRLAKDRERKRIKRATKTVEEREVQLAKDRERKRIKRAAQKKVTNTSTTISTETRSRNYYTRLTPENKQIRLNQMREYHNRNRENESLRREQYLSTTTVSCNYYLPQDIIASFERTIHQYAEFECIVCNKMYYRTQVKKVNNIFFDVIERYIGNLQEYFLCDRCHNYIKKSKIPSNAFWNKMVASPIPTELEQLTDIEIRLLGRVKPFMKIVRLPGRFGQFGLKGHAILFPQQVEELAVQLPLSANNLGMVIVSETLENIKGRKEFQVNLGHIQSALKWLKSNNELYKSVQIEIPHNIENICSQIFVRADDGNHETFNPGNMNIENFDNNGVSSTSTVLPTRNNENGREGNYSTFKKIAGNREILHGSFHQGSAIIPEEQVRGRQCTAIACIASVVGQTELNFCNWRTEDIDRVVLVGTIYYKKSVMLLNVLPENGHLMPSDLSTIVEIGNKYYTLNIDPDCTAGVTHKHKNSINVPGFHNTLAEGLNDFLETHSFGILTVEGGISIAVGKQSNKYWLFDSHSRGPMGRIANNGKAILMSFVNIFDLSKHICLMLALKNQCKQYAIAEILANEIINDDIMSGTQRSTVHENEAASMTVGDADCNTEGVQSTLHPMLLSGAQNILEENENSEEEVATNEIVTTALMPIDAVVPVIADVIENGTFDQVQGVKIHTLRRKTDRPLSALREKRAEELAWYTLFPDGKNGLGEDRDVPITPLDYFQTRIMGSDRRFSGNREYLFYALSMVEQARVSENVNVCGRLEQDGKAVRNVVNSLHVSMRKIRGTSAYWHDACGDLVAMVENLDHPSWYITLSCNDLNWDDMLKALLIADGRPDIDPKTLTFEEKKELVDKYPVTLSRHFSYRLNAIMRELMKDKKILGGKIVDFWWRIEFQLRGSPHVHMLVWCVDLPDFNSEEGSQCIDKVISCKTCTGDNELDELVKKLQSHKCTKTCFKKRDGTNCRFGYPRKPCNKTKILDPEEALRNGGRFCTLQRREEDCRINNYNPMILKLWKGNMDIQPCGSSIGVAYYISKYIAKVEPEILQDVVRNTIERVKAQGGTFEHIMFAVQMAILKHRQVSAAEAGYRLCHLLLRKSSRKCVFVNNCKPDERYRILNIQRDEICNNIFDKYENRPIELEALCLGEFATRYETNSKLNHEDDGDPHEESAPRKYITLMNCLGRMAIRERPAVLKTRHYTPDSDAEHYYYGLLVIHLPFRKEESLLRGFETSKEAFLARQNELRAISENMNVEQFHNLHRELQNAIQRLVAEDAIEQIGVPNTNAAIDNLMDGNDEGNVNCVLTQNDNDVIEDDLGEIESTRMSDEQFQACMGSLNQVQKNLVKIIAHTVQNRETSKSEPPLRLIVSGGAGSGKSYTLKLIIELLRRFSGSLLQQQGKSICKVGAPTGVSAKLIGGRTLHRLFFLPIDKKGEQTTFKALSGAFLELQLQDWKFVEWLIIDEISMVSYRTFRWIDMRLRQLKQCNEPFGGIKILLFGDLMQLPPVHYTHCFEQPEQYKSEIHLWRLFGFVELTTIMRQKNDSTFVDILNNLRVGTLTLEQLEILNNRRLHLVNDSGQFDDENAIRVFPTCKQVDTYNGEMCEKISSKGVKLYNVNAEDRSLEGATKGLIANTSTVPKHPNKTGGLLSTLKIGLGVRVMLRRNIDVSRGLVNGSMGIIKKIIWPALRLEQLLDGDSPQKVMVKFDDMEEEVEIEPVTVVFNGLRGSGKIERKMLPLILCWAVTVHKLQGVTMDRAVIDLGKKLFAKGQAYVALSRVKSLNGVAISELFAPRLLKNPHDEKALHELRRLRELPTAV